MKKSSIFSTVIFKRVVRRVIKFGNEEENEPSLIKDLHDCTKNVETIGRPTKKDLLSCTRSTGTPKLIKKIFDNFFGK